ncbi:PREDICTED: ferric reduction oxidase 2 [Tarenaya hassleriana]|uniref:ferric reduction oxidase 2 n=1 Tax=Tarenaya hassleriana TaxID=28532 RepID=UPI00053C1CF9|nr:PREDICTED: ferric reduction oxidase 2 [Tarenaya hassleriana]
MDRNDSVNPSPPGKDHLNDVIKGVIKLLIAVIFLGIIMIWIMVPTQTYRKIWLPTLRAKLGNSTYFGAAGTTLLLFTFPMILMACMGGVYLHLKKRKNVDQFNREMKGEMEVLRRPMLVKGPLGIVSVTEFGFLLMFVALLLWSFCTYLYNGFLTITPQSAAEDGHQVWQAKLETVALRFGVVGNICLAFLFLPVARGSSLLPLVGLTSESSIKYHIWLGHLAMTLFSAHGLSYILFWISTHHISQMIEWANVGVANLAGEISLVAGLAMWATTYPTIRRRAFEVFLYTHYLYIVFFLFFVLHVGVSYSFIAFPGFFIFMVDRFVRFLQSRDNVRLISARVLPCDTVELNFSKSPRLMYNPTSIMFVNIPSISKLQWHPFTITSSSNLEPEKMSVVIKGEGKWSTKLYKILSSSQIDRLPVSVEGPYGPVSTDFFRHESLVMVSGGSGITPFISIIRDLISASKTLNCETPKITLICAFKNSNDLSMLELILPMSGIDTDISSDLNIQIEAFITREKEPRNEADQKIRTLWLKPILSDQPISAILGPNSGLCLGAVLSSSFLIFLILIGIITRYYIYPIDHNTNKIFSSASRSILYALILCVSIMATATAAMLWNKNKYGTVERKQVESISVPTPTTASPTSWAYNAERELESSPRQSLLQSTNLHFGQRPDLTRLLLDTKGSSVGVLVCGPKKMRHEVAAICSSGLAKNLHFESISFSW